MSDRLYQSNVYLKECMCPVLSIAQDGCLVLEQNLFFPGGGGQPCDLGTINGVPLLEVFEKDGVIYHRLSVNAFKVGDDVVCRLDWDRRFEHMQRHCGEHILSGIFFSEFGGVNRGFHMGKDYMTIDIDLATVTPDMALRAELAANEVVWSDAPVSIRYFQDKSEAEKLPLRKSLTIDEAIIVVCVGDESRPSDCVACCGTHPSTAGQVGLIKLMKTESYKGMTRVYFEAGRRAFLNAVKEHQLIGLLAEKYSADEDTLVAKIRIQDDKNDQIRQSLQQYRQLLIQHEVRILLDSIATPQENIWGTHQIDAAHELDESPELERLHEIGEAHQIVVKDYDELRLTDLQQLLKEITSLSPNIFILISTQEKALLIGRAVSTEDGSLNCGSLIKAHAPGFNGKGGGSFANGRASFESLGDLDEFVQHIVSILLDEG